MPRQPFFDHQATGLERAILVGLVTVSQKEEQLKEYLDELAFLAMTAGAETIQVFYQKLAKPDIRFYVGKGKLQEIKNYIDEHQIDVAIFDDEISPSQLRNIEAEFKIKVLDRSMLILDIFALNAKTDQAKTQVELAQTQYLLPRLKGMWTHLDRIKGGIGMRGTGEKEIETDKRVAQKNIALLKQKLILLDNQNTLRRSNRQGMIRVALVGYTNVGKSTLMNALAKSDVYADNKLFATLETTVRKVAWENVPFLISDTVGFIRKLPHHLIESFKSTLGEVVESDILLHVIDVSHPMFEDQIKVVNQTLNEIGAIDKPILMVFNKMDNYERTKFDKFVKDEVKEEVLSELKNTWMKVSNQNAVFISALQKSNLAEMRDLVLNKVKNLYLERYPYKASYLERN